MNEQDAILPSRPSVSDEGALPPAAVAPATAPLPAPALDTPVQQATPPDRMVSPVSSLEGRMREITGAGGFTALPDDFGSPHGGWETVRSDDPFTILFLDANQAHRITPDIAARHRELLFRFWQEKLRSMSQGAARLAILHKYGGPEESERVIRGYPETIQRAYEQLSTRGGIDDAYRTITAQKESLLLRRVDEKLDDYLVDFVLQPDELRALLAFSEREGVSRAAVLTHVQQQLRTRGFLPEREPRGDTSEDQLLSTAWMHPSVSRPSVVAPPVDQRPRSVLLPVLAFSAVVVLVLLVAAALRTSQNDEGLRTPVTRQRPVVVPPPVAVAPQSIPEKAAATPRSDSASEHEVAVASSTLVADTEKKEQQARDREAEHQRVLGVVADIRGVVGSDPELALSRVSDLEKSIRSDDADGRVAAAALRSEIEKALLTRELERQKVAAEQAAANAARAQRDREWQQRLAQVEELMRQPNYSGAKALADRIVADPDVPPEVAQRARELDQQAIAELQKIFSKATIKSKTSRSPKDQP